MKNELLSFNSPLLNFVAMHIPADAPDDGNYKVFKKLTGSADGAILPRSICIGEILGRQGIYRTPLRALSPTAIPFTPIELRDLSSLVLTINDALSEEAPRGQLS